MCLVWAKLTQVKFNQFIFSVHFQYIGTPLGILIVNEKNTKTNLQAIDVGLHSI